ncbi:alkaline phosphatase-like protein [Piedraia hortae CBS 480.64]|uniref:GPI ethanolamine phosphate transferase 2 n=1 Tax=Piedraia hortae CBS 480.64 TaxID=1314780 RepID=A0A6A7BTY2_9PEZI|nr:alkaline phosphatase-like protein [Piedraia hortae CBS 480.64]
MRILILLAANLLAVGAVLIFAVGFFPYKPLLPGLASFPEGHSGGPDAIFDRVIFMVIDALRSDFVYGHNSGFAWTQSLVRDGVAIPFTAYSTPPTVTMPRVKALTTGSVPSFADLIFNLDESGTGPALAMQDTWLAQIKARGGRLVFYGDDTWLRLFPNDFFARRDGTSSFFVSVSRTGPGRPAVCIDQIAEYMFWFLQDFTEVDYNVTRHLPEELARTDWDAMILHYLGLDHIGHKTGPEGPMMLPKQREMDQVVEQIWKAIETENHHANTLFVLLGDHGMNAGGNHGGSGPGETEPALLFASPKLKHRHGRFEYQCPTDARNQGYQYYRTVQQSDIVPTLAGLMRFPIPKNSLGVFIDELKGCWPGKEGAKILYENSRQLKHIVEVTYERFSTKVTNNLSGASDCELERLDGAEDELACKWAAVEKSFGQRTGKDYDEIGRKIFAFLRSGQDALSGVASTYDISKMVVGTACSALGLLLATFMLPSLERNTAASAFCALVTVLHGLIMFASSFVEEEQQLWYWLTPAWFTMLTLSRIRSAPKGKARSRTAMAGAVILTVHRLSQRWNQTGQKHSGDADIVHGCFPGHHVLMWLLILATYFYAGIMIARKSFTGLLAPELAAAIAFSTTMAALIFKLNFTQAGAPELVQGLAHRIREWTQALSLVHQARFTFVLITASAITVTTLAVVLSRGTVVSRPDSPAVNVTLSERLHHLLTLFLMTQSRAPNIPLFLGMEVQSRMFRKLISPPSPGRRNSRRNAAISPIELATSILLLSHTYFFCVGGSNSISSIDLSQAYNGIGEYNVLGVGILLFFSNWQGPIWWTSTAVLLTFSKPSRSDQAKQQGQHRAWVEEEHYKLERDARVGTKTGESIGGTWTNYLAVMTVFNSTGVLATMVACTILRTHLFIWTVFSPKYLYMLAWTIGWHLLIGFGLGSVLKGLGQIA